MPDYHWTIEPPTRWVILDRDAPRRQCCIRCGAPGTPVYRGLICEECRSNLWEKAESRNLPPKRTFQLYLDTLQVLIDAWGAPI